MRWRMTGEVELDELLGDALMDQVTRSAGVSIDDIRRQLADMARRLKRQPVPRVTITLQGERLTP